MAESGIADSKAAACAESTKPAACAESTKPAASAESTKPLLLGCWNVAGWESTLKYINLHYASLSAFLDRHQFDVLCLQEVKVTKSKLSEHNAAAQKLGAHGLDGWESYWSCSQKGFNGCTTFVRKGRNRRADAAPLGQPALDAEGRCVLTDHGSFVLLNVYVHSTGGDTDGSRKAKKLEFLHALRATVHRLRAAGRAVCLAGDLNIALRAADGPWQLASVRVPSLRLGGAEHPTESLGAFHQAIGRDGATALAAALERLYGSRDRLRGHEVLAALSDVLASDASREIAPHVSPEAVESSTSATAKGSAAEGSGSKKSPGRSSVSAAPGAAVCSSSVSKSQPSGSSSKPPPAAPPDSPAVQALRRVVLELGESSSDQDTVAWLRSVIDEDGMVDTFSALRPHAEGRFTCWDQYKNGRYANNGRRIDYILIDRPLFESSVLAGPPLVEEEDEAGARRAATCNGRWLPAPWSGSSELQEAPQPTHDSQFVPPHTGIIYTAPGASDHVAVSLLLRGGTIPPQTLELDDATRACSFRPQRSIASFFGGLKPSKSQKVQ